MKKSTSASILLVALIAALGLNLNAVFSEGPKEADSWFEALHRGKQAEKMTKMHFFFHDIRKGDKATSVVVAQANVSSDIPFGVLAAGDDPITVGPEVESKRVGFFRGLYGLTSFEEIDYMTAMSFVFTEGNNNGSSLSVLGHNPPVRSYRELPVVGGSGRFRLARGAATFHAYYTNRTTGIFTVEVHIIVFHY